MWEQTVKGGLLDEIRIYGALPALRGGDRREAVFGDRYLVGFGSGKSGVAVAGSVASPDGTVIATFAQKRIGVMGVGGGDSTNKLVSDATSIGKDIADFLAAWSAGKKLK